MIQHSELDGPFSIPTAWTTQTVDGQPVQVPTAFADNRWNTTPGFYAAHSAALAALPRRPHTRTIALAFPDAATAELIQFPWSLPNCRPSPNDL